MVKKIKNFIELYLIMFFPIWISIGRFVPGIETVVSLIFIVLLLSEQLLKKRTIIKYLIMFVLFFISGIMDSDISMHIDHIKPLIIMFLAIDAKKSELYDRAYMHIEKYSKALIWQLFIILTINIVFIFFDIGYSDEYSGLWALKAFRGIYSDPHQCAYHMCALMVILLIATNKNSKFFSSLILLGYLYCSCITGARIPTILSVFLGAIFCVNYIINPFRKQQSSSKMTKFIILFIIAIFSGYFIMNYTSFGLKSSLSVTNGNLDSGRSILRERDWELFKKGSWINKLFGYGTNNVIEYHGSFKYSSKIWSHNDFMQILCGMGLFMCLIYIFAWLRLLRDSFKESYIETTLVILLILVAFYNGLYIHTRLVFVIPLLLNYIKARKIEDNKVIEKNLIGKEAL